MINQSILKRFWSFVEILSDDECWLWLGGKTGSGYGRFWMNGKNRCSNRVALEIKIGRIPDGLFACHTCDNPSCCNPKHLFCGTPKQNMDDMIRKGRAVYKRLKRDKYIRGENHHLAVFT